jgi:hypothetical protein
MYRSARSFEQSWSARQSEVPNIVATYRFLAPAVFAARERLAKNLAHQAMAGDDAPRGTPRPIRRWLGERLIRLGTRLGGAGVPREVMPPTARHGVTAGG